ncbi:facilitated trehalose transporter Tret1-like [Zerene cesonia]|uniref:facilitated trehalose transporter Tret1-like n=1 Tax=Zerene cesonia TaxID=33412 RepID=UPI0018E556C9|nr:facilitated trehalose transporter Tret1-like [Zerene cesonia]
MGRLHQYLTTLASILSGILNVWPSYTLSYYTSQNTTLLSAPMTSMESSLLGSLPALGALLGTACAGMIIDGFGRKKGGIVIAMPYLFSWLMIDMTSSSIVILVARFVAGIAAGASSVHAPIYISEIAEESIRGALGSAPIASYCIGAMVSYLMGWMLPYRYIIWSGIGLCVIYIGLLMSVKESPVFLMRKNREEEARQSIAHYRGEDLDSKVVMEELSRLKQRLLPAVELVPINESEVEKAEKENLNGDNDETVEHKRMPSYKMLFVSASSRRAFTTVGLVISLQVMMGMVPVQVYAKDIFTKAAPSLSSHMCSVMFAFVLMAGSLSCALFSDRFGRKPLLLSSAIGVCLCLITMGVLMQTNIAPPWVSAVLILMYCFAFSFGAGSVPYLLLSEVFVSEVQNLASMILMEWVWLLNFGILAIFPFMVQYFGVHGSFYFFAVFAVLDIIVALVIVPETKGLTKEQIQEAFLGRRQK